MCDIKLTLAAARVNAGLSQREAASLLKISPSTLCAWENGRSEVSKIALMALANLYELPVEAISMPTIST